MKITKIKKHLKWMQKNEITKHYLYNFLVKKTKNKKYKAVLSSIAKEELEHYNFIKNLRKKDAKPIKLKIAFYKTIFLIFGFCFTVRLMERVEMHAENVYEQLTPFIKNINELKLSEIKHKTQLIDMLKDEKLKYLGSIVLGLSDAIVELTGAITGLTLAITDMKVISLSALTCGIAASLSMASSEYLSNITDGYTNAKKAAIYTGIAYLITVLVLVSPYLFISSNKYLALSIMFIFAVLIIFVFNFYTAVVKKESFRKKFLAMLLISLSVASISFVIGYIIKTVLGVDV